MTSPCGSTNNLVNSAYVFSTVVILKWLIMKPNRNRLHHLMLNCASGNTLLSIAVEDPPSSLPSKPPLQFERRQRAGIPLRSQFYFVNHRKGWEIQVVREKVWTKNFAENLKKKFRFFSNQENEQLIKNRESEDFLKTI